MKPISDVLWPRFLAFPVFAVVGQLVWMSTSAPTSVFACAIWIPILTYCWFCVGGLAHELVHQNLPFGPRASRAIGSIIGTSIGIPYTVYKEVHMRHHAYLNTPLDFELWPYCDPDASLRFRRTFLWFDLFAGSLATPLIWGRICFSSKSPVSDKVKRIMRHEYLAIAFVWMTAAGIQTWVFMTGRLAFHWQNLIFAAPLILAANCNSIRKVMEHLGTRSFDPMRGTRTIIGRGLITRALSYFNFDIAVHGPHHRYPKLNHALLKSRMSEMQNAAPTETFPVFRSFTSALYDAFRTAVSNPAVGVNAGCNDDLSHLPLPKDAQPPADGPHFGCTIETDNDVASLETGEAHPIP